MTGLFVSLARSVSLSKLVIARRSRVLPVAVLCLEFAAFGQTAGAQSASVGSTAPASVQSQQTSSPENKPVATMAVHVNVVNVLATVRDKHGKIISYLTKDDFLLSEDGRPQTIRYFTQRTDLPLTLGLLVDTSLSQRRVLDQERSASHSFLDQMVREDKDKAFIIHFDREVELLQDLTPSHEKLETALGELATPQLSRERRDDSPGSEPGPRRGSGMRSGGTLLYDAIYLASDELMQKQQGRKALIVLSDGVDRGSKESLENAIAAAQRADTLVYSVLFKDDEGYGGYGGGERRRGGFGIPGMGGPGTGGPGMGRRGGPGGRYPREERPDGKKILDRISKETGGRLFVVSKKEPIDQIYAQIADELRHQYNLGYTPSEAVAPGYHKIQLTTKKKDLIVQARDGYYSGQ
jgi:VWFA-related protein